MIYEFLKENDASLKIFYSDGEYDRCFPPNKYSPEWVAMLMMTQFSEEGTEDVYVDCGYGPTVEAAIKDLEFRIEHDSRAIESIRSIKENNENLLRFISSRRKL